MTAATDASHFPVPLLPEVAFLGRSNVGKSSVINSLIGSKVAKTSSTPGRTRSINFFEVRWPGRPHPEVIFTDLPGYGYARVPQGIAEQWPGFIEPYLRERPSLALCLALVDINVPLQPGDRQLLTFLSATNRPFLVVATKTDRLSNNQLRNAIKALSEQSPQAQIVPYSARNGSGRDELWQHIRAAVEQRAATR